ncbi:hypothetical protein DV965_17375 [Staphylococcus pseudintermedius]|nr:hypothetical protein DV965_17375 [Staphylococcus pseudintermedius]
MVKKYTGENINVYFEPKRCVHATECIRGLGEVLEVEKRPCVQPATAAVDDFIIVVERFPSGPFTSSLSSNQNQTHS